MLTGRRMLKLSSLIAAALLLAAVPLTALAQADQPAQPAATEEPVGASIVTLTGTITNGTSGGAVPADMLVTLRVINPQMAETNIETTAGADGAFSFADVTILPDHAYVATVDYGDAVFASPLLRGDQVTSASELPIIIYEFTDDPAVLAIDALQSQVAVSLNEMQVLELYRFINSGDRAYRAADGGSVRVNIPEGAQLVDMGSTRFLPSEDGTQMIDTAPVLPGDPHTLHVLYTLPYGGAATVSHTVEVPLLNGFQVVIDTPGLTVTGDGIEPLGGGSAGMAFGVSASMPAGATVSYTVSGVPEAAPTVVPAQTATTPTTTASTIPAVPTLSIVLMLLGGVCVGIAAVLFFRERRRPAAAAPQSAADPRVNALVQQIAELDVAFQAGTISQTDYDTQRNALKSQLMSLARTGAEE